MRKKNKLPHINMYLSSRRILNYSKVSMNHGICNDGKRKASHVDPARFSYYKER